MFDYNISGGDLANLDLDGPSTKMRQPLFEGFKRGFDIVFSCTVLLATFLLVLPVLLILNPFCNPGPLFFRQTRMGLNGKTFTMIKFRTMVGAQDAPRQADAPLERDRISRLGHALRKSRLDEVPQLFNILRGEMSLSRATSRDFRARTPAFCNRAWVSKTTVRAPWHHRVGANRFRLRRRLG